MVARVLIVVGLLDLFSSGVALAQACGPPPPRPLPNCSMQPICVCDVNGQCQFIWQCS